MYQQVERSTAEDSGFRRCVSTVVAEVPLSRYLEDIGIRVKRQGLRLVCLCLLHDEKTPSFTVYGDSSYYCFGCGEWGDVVGLHFRLNNFGEMFEAMIDLAQRYNVALPERSPKWLAWQKKKDAIRDMSEDIRFRVRCRRLFKVCILSWPEIQTIEDPVERREEILKCWREFEQGLREVSR